MSPNRRLEGEMSGDPPIDNVDPLTEWNETLLIELRRLSKRSAITDASNGHVAAICAAAADRIQELELLELVSEDETGG